MQVWNTMALTVLHHSKGNEDRGYVLGDVAEVLLALDDNCMNLQSMAASQ